MEADVVAAARRLIPQVLAAREECETLRRVPTPMVEALAEAGLLQMYLPRSMGGPELPPLVVFRAIEEISRADGSIGWCTMIATAVSNSTGWLDPEVGRAIAGQPCRCEACGLDSPAGPRTPGRRRLSHRRSLGLRQRHQPCALAAMPLRHLGWRQADARTVGRADGAIILGSSQQAPDQDTWHVLGLRGTGSHDFIVADVFVPESHSFSNGEASDAGGPTLRVRACS